MSAFLGFATIASATTIDNQNPQVGDTLNATSDNPGADTITWTTCGTGTVLATDVPPAPDSYTVLESDVGTDICATDTTTSSAPAQVGPVIPAISGTPQEGQTLSAVGATNPAVVTYQWQDCDASGQNCSAITGATGSSYEVQYSDVSYRSAGSTIELVDTPVSGPGTAQSSQPTGTLTAAPPAATTGPTTAGTPTVGATLTESAHANWSPADALTYTYAWQRQTSNGWQTVATQTSPATPSYGLTSQDLGAAIRLVETATNGTGPASATGSPITSTPTAQVGETTTLQTVPAIFGSAQQGATLTASPGAWSPTPTSYAYQWERCGAAGCIAIPGATAATYVPTADDVGSALAVSVTASVYSTASGPVTSGPTAAVLPAPPAAAGAPTVAGTPLQGQTLTASPGPFRGGPSGYAYAWSRCSGGGCAAIPGATGSTYRLTDADVGSGIAVTVVATNSGGSSLPVASAPTGTVLATGSVSLVLPTTHPRAGAPFTLTAIVASDAAGALPRGRLTVADGGQALTGCTRVRVDGQSASATVTCTTRLPGGTAHLVATFTPEVGSDLVGSASPARTVTVDRSTPTVRLRAPATVAAGGRASLTATVTAAKNQVVDGRVAFRDGHHAVKGCAAVRLRHGTARCSASLPAGRHRITAVYAGDRELRSASSRVRTVTVAAASTAPLGDVTATMRWTFHFTPGYTQILALVLRGARPGSQIAVSCHGRGCPSRLTPITVHRAGAVDLERRFHGRRLGVGARVIVTVTRTRYVGKYYRFTIRRSHQPAVRISCLAPGSSRPGVGCSAH